MLTATTLLSGVLSTAFCNGESSEQLKNNCTKNELESSDQEMKAIKILTSALVGWMPMSASKSALVAFNFSGMPTNCVTSPALGPT